MVFTNIKIRLEYKYPLTPVGWQQSPFSDNCRKGLLFDESIYEILAQSNYRFAHSTRRAVDNRARAVDLSIDSIRIAAFNFEQVYGKQNQTTVGKVFQKQFKRTRRAGKRDFGARSKAWENQPRHERRF